MGCGRASVVLLALASACRASAPTSDSDATSSDDASDDPVEPSITLCPSAGLGPQEVLLVGGDDERVVVVHADGSTTEIDPHGVDAKAVDHRALFDFAGAYVVTASTWRGELGATTDLRLFLHDGTPLWSVNVPAAAGNAPSVNASGEVIFQTNPDALLIRGGSVIVLPEIGVLGRGPPPWLAVTSGQPTTSVGWLRTDSLEYVPTDIVGTDVAYDDGLFVSGSWGDEEIGVRWSAFGEPVSELFFAHDETTRGLHGQMRFSSGPFVLFSDAYEFNTFVLVDLEHETIQAGPLAPPPGYASLPCAWPTLDDSGTVLTAFSDGARLQSFARPIGGDWQPTIARALSGVKGADTWETDGSYLVRSIESSGPCTGDEPLAEIEGTLRGTSVQVFRPVSGVVHALSQTPSTPHVVLGAEGECAAMIATDGEIMIADMGLGTSETIAAPSSSGFLLAGHGDNRSSLAVPGG